MTPVPVDLVVAGGTVVTMDADRRVLDGASIGVRAGVIAGVGPADAFAAARTIDARGLIVTPGLVNAHVHLTGPSLLGGAEPDESPFADHFPRWVLPAHAASDPDAERAAARLVALQMLRHGTTAFVEAGVCRFPEAVLDGLADVGMRGTIGAWASDRWPVPGEEPRTTAQVVTRVEQTLALTGPEDLLRTTPALCGHDACSDALYRAAARLAREHARPWTFHLSATEDDRVFFQAEHGADPLVHLDQLGVVDQRVTISHAIHLTDDEATVLAGSGATVAFCPGAALRLCTGVSRAGRHPELPWLAFGTDTQNASNHLDLLRAGATAAGLYGELRGERSPLTAERVLECLTLGGARALGLDGVVGAIEPGQRADLAAFDPGAPVWNVANALVHGAARAVHVIVDGRPVMVDGRVPGEAGIVADAAVAAERIRRRIGLPRHTGWAPVPVERPAPRP